MSILNTIKSPIIYFAKNSLCMRVGCQRSYPGSGRRAAREKMGGAEKITVLSEPVHDFFTYPSTQDARMRQNVMTKRPILDRQ